MDIKELIQASARRAFKTKELPIGPNSGGPKITLRELNRSERQALNARLFVCGEDDNPLPHSGGKPDPAGSDWKLRPGVPYVEEWLAATMTPQFTVEELLADDWPESLKERLCDEARALNGITVEEAVKN